MIRNPGATQPSRPYLAAVLTGYLLLVVSLAISNAQVPSAITPDGTLGTIVTHDGRVFGITGGTRPDQGPNLFHSFGQFDVGTGDTAHFVAQPGVDNIIGRVTGGSASLIDGRLRSEASLFLLNPSGLMFGPHATLDVNGSFHASTADALRFADGAMFSAELNEKSRLTVAAPSAFGFLSENPAGIAIEGSSLQVLEGETISLVGGDIKIVGRRRAADDPPTISAPSGRINLVSVASPGNVTISSPDAVPRVTVASAARQGVIDVSDMALLSVTGDGGGTVVVRGGRFLMDNALIFADTLGASRGAPVGVDVVATEAMVLGAGALISTDVLGAGAAGNIEVRAPSIEVTTGAVLGSRAWSGSTGDTGHIALRADQLKVTQGGGVTTSVFAGSQGNAGRVEVQAGDLRIDGAGSNNPATYLANISLGGNTGDIEINAQSLTLQNGGIVGNISLSGNTGDVKINTQSLTLQNGGIVGNVSLNGNTGNIIVDASDTISVESQTFFSGLLSVCQGGEPGRIELKASHLNLNGGVIGAPSVSSALLPPILSIPISSGGRSGDVSIDVGTLIAQNHSIISSLSAAEGPAGKVWVRAQRMTLTGGSKIDSSTLAQGDAGSVVVLADELRIDGTGISDQATGIFSQANSGSSGNAGTVTVTVADLVELLNGGVISSSTFAQGDAGSVAVQAGELRIDGFSNPDQLTGIISLATREATGLVGHIEVEAGTVRLLNGGTISIEARQTLPESQITEPIETRILISADHLHLDGEASITAESTGNAPASVVEIHAGDLLMEGESRIATTSNEASGGNIQVIAQAMAWLQDSTVTATVRGGPGTHGGNITMGSEFIILENSQIVSDAFQGRGGDIAIEAVVLLADPTSSVSAKARDSEVGIDGQVDIRALVTNLSGLVTPLPPGFAPAAELLRNRCVAQLHAGTVSSLVDRGRAGVPATPEGIQPGRLYQPCLTSAVPPKMERQPGKTEAMQQGMLAVAPVGGPSIISRPFPAHAPVTLKCNWTKP